VTIHQTEWGPAETLPCPTCGQDWTIGRDPAHPEAGPLLRSILGECADCRGMGDEPTVTLHVVDGWDDQPRNRAERRADARRRR
jgi:hypothetical protein